MHHPEFRLNTVPTGLRHCKSRVTTKPRCQSYTCLPLACTLLAHRARRILIPLCEEPLGEQEGGAGVARAWRGRGAGFRLRFGMSGVGMARAWRGLQATIWHEWRGHGAGMARAVPVPPLLAVRTGAVASTPYRTGISRIFKFLGSGNPGYF
eukprot:gene258-biopygen21089